MAGRVDDNVLPHCALRHCRRKLVPKFSKRASSTTPLDLAIVNGGARAASGLTGKRTTQDGSAEKASLRGGANPDWHADYA
jgi:hypothetical protein